MKKINKNKKSLVKSRFRKNKLLNNRYKMTALFIKNENYFWGTFPKHYPFRPFFFHLHKLFNKVSEYDKVTNFGTEIKPRDSKGNKRYHLTIIYELHNYILKTLEHGVYYSTIVLKSLYSFYNIKSNSQFLKSLRSEKARVDTLLSFSVSRSRLEELILSLFFLFKAKILIKEKKWFDLYKLIHKINYSNYKEDFKINSSNDYRLLKKHLDKLFKKNTKLHVSEMTKYVVSHKELKDDFDPAFYLEKYKQSINKKKQYMLSKFIKINKIKNFSNKIKLDKISKIYNLLSDHLHPNNLITRNLVMTSENEVNDLLVHSTDHMRKIFKSNEYISDVLEVVYKQNFGIYEYFTNQLNNETKNKELINGINLQISAGLSKLK